MWKKLEFYEKGILAILGFLLIIVAFVGGAIYGNLRTKDLLYNEFSAENKATWIRIEEIGENKIDLMTRLDRLARAIEQYDLAVAQIKIYEKRREIMNVRLSDDD